MRLIGRYASVEVPFWSFDRRCKYRSLQSFDEPVDDLGKIIKLTLKCFKVLTNNEV